MKINVRQSTMQRIEAFGMIVTWMMVVGLIWGA